MANQQPPDEGYIKFRAEWVKTEPFAWGDLAELNLWRDACYRAGWIGAYPNGISFGNLSQRCNWFQFYITGSATGHLARLGPEHYAMVMGAEIDRNVLHCRGPIIASSESMSHAVIYETLPGVQGVIHIHHPGLWRHLLRRAPTTPEEVPYGSPKMAYAIRQLITDTYLPDTGVLAMGGHPEGIIAFGRDLGQAFRRLEQAMHAFAPPGGSE